MKMTSDNGKDKTQIGLRIPAELNSRLESLVSRIGISKPAFILNLIFNELEKIEKNSRADDNDNN